MGPYVRKGIGSRDLYLFPPGGRSMILDLSAPRVAMRNSRNRSKERGSITFIAAISMVALVGFTGMAVDVGYLQWTQVRIQDATDAAAQAALIELENGNTDWVTAGQNAAAMNGFVNGANGVTVTVNNPPTQGTMKGQTNALEAIITQTT